MFNSNSGLSMDGDHLDLSYRDRDVWPSLTPKGAIKAFNFDVGDEIAGPNLQLGLITEVADEPLNWQQSIDPVHHHGSDQFRVVSGGGWVLAGRDMAPGDYAFQEAGWVYQEHPSAAPANWLLLLMGDRRGNQATLRFEKNKATIVDFGEMSDIYGVPPKDGRAYPHPAGDKGLTAIATTDGRCERGYKLGKIADVAGALTGVLGEERVGPLVHVLRGGPNEALIPSCVYETELVFVVAGGSCRVGDKHFQAGDVRIQRAGAPFAPVIAGAHGVSASFIVADRRARPRVLAGETPAWMSDIDRVMGDVSPVPGGVAGERVRAQRSAEAV